jgi:predicted nucleotide-binding protein
MKLSEELEERAHVLENLHWSEAGVRLQGLLNWMQSQPAIKPIIAQIDSQVDGMALLNQGSYHRAPQAGTDEEIAAVGLALIRATHHTPLHAILTGRGIRASGSSQFQDHVNSAVVRYFRPFVAFVFRRLATTETQTEPSKSSRRSQTSTSSAVNGKGVFIVHGRDDGPKETVARFLERLGLKATILHEEINRGRTIIEKFEDHADVQFAIVILTPDDLGRFAAEADAVLEPRARQNVVFEMGYFIGRIGRHCVFPLKVGAVQIPSDYSGVAYTDMDTAGAWRVQLVRELKAAHFEIDANKAFQ